ncbi:MAG TPA: MmoB/DmpM family protein [Polyangia bacterium]|nr:MmoB/DmpM family protein [Polyangia bacterium]
MEDAVGPVLRMCEEIEPVIRAIIEDNPGQEVEVIDHGAYVRVRARGTLRVTRASIQRQLGDGFEMRKLGAMLSAFAGRIATTSDEITWTLTPVTGSAGARAPAEEDVP